MNLSELNERFQKLRTETERTGFRKILNGIRSLLDEIEIKNISEAEKK